MYKIFLMSFFLALTTVQVLGQPVSHSLEVSVDPSGQYLKVTDNMGIALDSGTTEIRFRLNADLIPVLDNKTEGYVLEELPPDTTVMKENDPRISWKSYRVQVNDVRSARLSLQIKYEGKINYPITQISKEYARGFSETPGIISEQGIYLAGSTGWIPQFDGKMLTFNMTVFTPPDWDVVSQGKRTRREGAGGQNIFRWESMQPMEEIYLIAAKFTYYEKPIGNVMAMAYLRTPDPALAGKYLETTTQYLEMYNKLIGPYPFDKFALVENFWETGYGMPSFTLLGEKVIRFPFILHSSYPHELLHNWWGNSVYVDYNSGNWCEGLTAYMADHLIKEQRGQGLDYRRSALQSYTDYVNEENDFPLSEFRSRYDAASSAIGYNKSLMLFNMLRQAMGDEQFTKAMQTFYRDNKFRRASWEDIRRSVGLVTGKNMQFGFDQWIKGKGAPELQLTEASVSVDNGIYRLSYTLGQIQKGDTFLVTVPVGVHLKGKTEPFMQRVELNSVQQNYEMTFESEPLLIEVDPLFDVFRRLHQNEIPPALSQIFGSRKVMIILPAGATEDKLSAFTKLANTWAGDDSGTIDIRQDSQIINLPTDRAVWVFGSSNKFRSLIEAGMTGYDAEISADQIRFGETGVPAGGKSTIVAVRNPGNPENVVVWLDTEVPEAADGLARKLPHYGKYSYLVFEGKEPTNIVKGQWPVINSPLVKVLSADESNVRLAGTNYPERQALAELPVIFSEDRMRSHIAMLASEDMQGRGLGSPQIDRAAEYIAGKFAEAGLEPGSDDGSFFQTWQDIVGKDMKNSDLKNVIGILPGTNPDFINQSVVVCAHYDHLGLGWPDVREGNAGKVHYGADDNASGVAVLLELAKVVSQSGNPERTIVFVAFTGEEAGLKGSRYFVKNYKKYPPAKAIGALNFDTVGRLGENKIHIIGSASASEWKHIAMGVGYVTGIAYELISQDLDASDQASFIESGVPGIQLFAGPNEDYHKPTDTVDKIDVPGLVKFAIFGNEIISYLTSRKDAMSFEGKVAGPQQQTDRSGEKRKVSTGIMPDFSFKDPGVKVSFVTPGSPADKAGILKDDVIIQLNYTRITDLKQYSNELKSYQIGDEVTIVVLRGTTETRIKLTLTER